MIDLSFVDDINTFVCCFNLNDEIYNLSSNQCSNEIKLEKINLFFEGEYIATFTCKPYIFDFNIFKKFCENIVLKYFYNV